jgi:thiol-disulfide isomerase/thioredoxin
MSCKKTGYLLLLIFSGFVTKSSAQAKSVRKVRPGQQMPDLRLTHLLDSSKVYHLSDYWRKGPLMIMNMGMRCTYCLQTIPELQRFREKYPQLQVIVNAKESIDTMRALFKRRSELVDFDVKIPVVGQVPQLTQLTGADQQTSFLWIQKGGVLAYITDNQGFNDSTVALFAAGKRFTPVPIEKELGYNPVKPLLLDGYGGPSGSMKGYSVFTSYLPGMPPMSGLAKDTNRSIALVYNTSIKNIYQSAYNDTGNDSYWLPDNRTDLRVQDTTPYVCLFNGQFRKSNMYCVQMIVPRVSKDSMRILWQQELPKYFPLRARIEKQKRLCWVLKANDTSLLTTKGGRKMQYIRDPVRHSLRLLNYPIVEINELFTFSFLADQPLPFVNETGIKGSIDLFLDGIVFNFAPATIQKALENTGLYLVKEERMVNILVLEERKVVAIN